MRNLQSIVSTVVTSILVWAVIYRESPEEVHSVTHANQWLPGPEWQGWEKTGDDRFNWFLSHIQFQVVPNFTAPGIQVCSCQDLLLSLC